jgi:hypothetical protein
MKVGDKVEIIGGFSFMVGEICKVIAVSNDKFNLFPIRVASKIMEYAVFPESQLKLMKEAWGVEPVEPRKLGRTWPQKDHG